MQCSKQQFLFDHLVGAGEQRLRDFEAERFRGAEVDHKLDLGALLDWQIGRPFAFENAPAVDAHQANRFGAAGPLAHAAG